MGDRRLARRRIQRGDLDDHLRPSAIQKFLDGSATGAPGGLQRQPPLVECAAVAQRVRGDDAKRIDFALLFEKPGEGPPDVAVTDECQFQKSTFSKNALSSDSSAVFLRFRPLCWSRSAASFVSAVASCVEYCCTSSC